MEGKADFKACKVEKFKPETERSMLALERNSRELEVGAEAGAEDEAEAEL